MVTGIESLHNQGISKHGSAASAPCTGQLPRPTTHANGRFNRGMSVSSESFVLRPEKSESWFQSGIRPLFLLIELATIVDVASESTPSWRPMTLQVLHWSIHGCLRLSSQHPRFKVYRGLLHQSWHPRAVEQYHEFGCGKPLWDTYETIYHKTWIHDWSCRQVQCRASGRTILEVRLWNTRTTNITQSHWWTDHSCYESKPFFGQNADLLKN